MRVPGCPAREFKLERQFGERRRDAFMRSDEPFRGQLKALRLSGSPGTTGLTE